MPEGDTIYKVASVLASELEGEVLSRCSLRGIHRAERLAGARVLAIETVGKHLLIHLDRELFIRVHLGMHGSWHRYPRGVPWQRKPTSASVILETARSSLVCFFPMEVEVIPTVRRRWHRQLESLGPDLLTKAEPDWEEVLRRCHRLHPADVLLGEVLLDQRVVAGLGNVYKSEIAFMGPLEEGANAFQFAASGYTPWMGWGEVPSDDFLSMLKRGRHLLWANLGGWSRTTRADRRIEPAPPAGSLYVYGRAGKACPRCSGEIAKEHQGLQARVTYWCRACQRGDPPD